MTLPNRYGLCFRSVNLGAIAGASKVEQALRDSPHELECGILRVIISLIEDEGVDQGQEVANADCAAEEGQPSPRLRWLGSPLGPSIIPLYVSCRFLW